MFVAAAMLVVLVPLRVEDPDRALQSAVAGALAADTDDRLLEVALEQYPAVAPAVAITYGHLGLFREQMARFGPQVVPIVAAYQRSLTTADALQLAGQALHTAGQRLAGDGRGPKFARLTPEARGLLALLKMRDEGNAFVGQWEITATGDARRVPSRLITLGGPELLLGGLTALERDLVQEKPIDWRTYGLAAVDVAAIASGVALLRFARTAGRSALAARAATRTIEPGVSAARAGVGTATLRPGALATAEVLGINAIRFGVPVGLAALMALHPSVFTHYAWLLAESLGMPGIIGPIVGWSLVILPLSFLLSWLMLSVRVLRLTGWLSSRLARGCQRLAVRLAAAGDH
jgi:hypothetical protein